MPWWRLQQLINQQLCLNIHTAHWLKSWHTFVQYLSLFSFFFHLETMHLVKVWATLHKTLLGNLIVIFTVDYIAETMMKMMMFKGINKLARTWTNLELVNVKQNNGVSDILFSASLISTPNCAHTPAINQKNPQHAQRFGFYHYCSYWSSPSQREDKLVDFIVNVIVLPKNQKGHLEAMERTIAKRLQHFDTQHFIFLFLFVKHQTVRSLRQSCLICGHIAHGWLNAKLSVSGGWRCWKTHEGLVNYPFKLGKSFRPSRCLHSLTGTWYCLGKNDVKVWFYWLE